MKKEKNIELIYSEVKERLNRQIDSIDQVAVKFNFLLALNSIILASLLQSNLLGSRKECISWMMFFAVVCFFLSILFDLRGLVMQKYRRDPDPQKLYEGYFNKSKQYTQEVLIINYVHAFNENVKKLHHVNKFFAYSIFSSSIALIFVFINLINPNLIFIWKMIIKMMCQICQS
ncbi:MAG: hypothetical protein WC819_04965 [Parcubacteria group bacterium]|jgi:hypothetical protein